MLRILLSLLAVLACISANAEPLDKLVIANSKAWKPFSFINHKGDPDGILVDYWREYGRKNNVEIEFLLLDWQASLDAVRDGQADIHAGLLWSEQRDSYLDYAPEILSIDTQMYIGQALIGTNLDAFMLGEHQHLVGVVAGGYEEEFTRRHFPNLNLISYSNNQLMIEAAFSGELDAFVADLQVANFYLFSSDEPQRFIGVRHLYSGNLRAAVSEGNTALQQQITRGINEFGNDEKQQIFNRWMYVSTVYPDYLVPVAALVIGIVTLSYIIALKLTVKVRTNALEQANLELKTLSETDQLTELSNRRHFVNEFQQRLKEGGSMSVMIFDIDDFKQINDSYGHQSGDIIIKSVAHAASNILPEHHLIGRIGGEEFAIFLCGETYEASVVVAEQVCAAVRKVKLLEDSERKVSVSLGCAYYPSTDLNPSLSDADHLMYQSKTNGKDRVTAKVFS
ncbi:sensor domain-containing diguanylate cyclase [Vibrio tubiashii]|uniref:transporter substrate-binding domain-containing diguanylate cyclase n=1 Tax=Vibrio tubiashii TaxID=29498 RepID=UPI00234EA8CF|nr:sensor domain-containing diguanylate cyclase [Vibrio tubiashii]WCP68864.1 sensor domain-containing diguanylate cyclase [Vibrio tubiashii]